ncbi:MAG: class I SAM-dependent methyltransferase [Lachnospiraceae bacterium]|nr:class I SAM-dependent methyltransferase [Lachnospiraceae bacterium]
MAKVYADFAEVYDELMDETPYAQWCENLTQLIARYGVSRPVERRGMQTCERSDADALASERDLVLDLGCGTGTLTQLLYTKGYDMIGVDNAPAMLNIAMRKREESGADILYLLQDMRDLELYSTVGTVISVCDSVNYILAEEELLEVFRLVNNYLYPGGVFIFDFNTVYKYRTVIGDTVIAENREDCSFIWENFYDEESCVNQYDVTVFVQEGRAEDQTSEAEADDLFRRFRETHLQRGYTLTQMETLIRMAGMEFVRALDADSLQEVTDESERIYVVAREHGKSKAVEPNG